MEKLQEDILQKFNDFESSLNGSRNSAIHKKRQGAIAEIKAKGFPNRKTEDWRYTFMTKHLEKFFDYQPSTIEESVQSSDFKGFENNAIEIINLNGIWNLGELPKITGLHISTFEEAIKKEDKTFFTHFDSISSKENTPFGALNTAFSQNGLFIHTDKGLSLEREIIVHYISDTTEENVFTQPRLLLVSEENTELTLIENYVKQGNHDSYSNACTEISVAKNAHVSYYKLQLDSSGDFHSGLCSVDQYGGSVFNAYCFSFEGQMLRNDLDIHLLGEHIESNMYGTYVLSGKSHVDNHTSVNHAFPNCNSNELYKGILNESSTGVFNGKIFVRKDAQKTNAFQSNRNLILSADATVHTKPQLEIWADDVKCSHGATIGQLDEEQLFYLRSRGISRNDAIILLTRAFIEEVIEKVKLDYIKVKLEKALDKKLKLEV